MIDELSNLNSEAFEQLIGELWERRGYEVKYTPASQDGGIDIIATKRFPHPLKELLQAKCYSTNNPVSVSEIREYAGLRQVQDVDAVILITSSRFTTQAHEFAAEVNLKLIDGETFIELLESEQATHLIERYTATDSSPEWQRRDSTTSSSTPKLDDMKAELERRGISSGFGFQSIFNLTAILEDTYQLSSSETDRILDALRIIYSAQESDSVIGMPHLEMQEFASEVEILDQLKLVYEHHYTGASGYGYRCTQEGEKIGSELVAQFIEQNSQAIMSVLEGYSTDLLGVLFSYGYKKSDMGYFTTRGAEIRFAQLDIIYVDYWDPILPMYESLQRELIEVGAAVQSGKQAVMPPEFVDLVEEVVSYNLAAQVDALLLLEEVADGKVEIRSNLEELLEFATVSDFKQLVNQFADSGVTTSYTDRSPPFIVKDGSSLTERIEDRLWNLLNSASGSTSQ